jgi:hypothetical protein
MLIIYSFLCTACLSLKKNINYRKQTGDVLTAHKISRECYVHATMQAYTKHTTMQQMKAWHCVHWFAEYI